MQSWRAKGLPSCHQHPVVGLLQLPPQHRGMLMSTLGEPQRTLPPPRRTAEPWFAQVLSTLHPRRPSGLSRSLSTSQDLAFFPLFFYEDVILRLVNLYFFELLTGSRGQVPRQTIGREKSHLVSYKLLQILLILRLLCKY